MIVRIDTHILDSGQYGYTVSARGDELYSDSGLSSIVHCMAAAVEGFGEELKAAEFACRGIVSGTYTLHTLATKPGTVAQHAVNTANAVYAAEH